MAGSGAIPGWLRYRKGRNEKSPVWFIDLRGTDFDPASPGWQAEINRGIGDALREIALPARGPVLIKCHIGEGRCRTRMLPEYCISTVEHFRRRGIRAIAAGDSTVAYSGDRGYHDNHGGCDRYMALAERHGWTESGPLGVPFVVLDRPETSVRGRFTFRAGERKHRTRDSRRFREVYLAGGFAAAGAIVNHVHLTLHDMAQVACAVKGIAMGGSSYRGKLIMHKCYSPSIDPGGCRRCGQCAVNCPEGALRWRKGGVPRLEGDACIGCGECVAVCHGGSISMASSEIEDWARGGDTLPYRMSDYLMGMMEGRWDRLINVVHLYNITRRCDCVDRPQKPILRHMGFLVGRNPFAVDLMATRLLHDEVHRRVEEGGMKASGPLQKAFALRLFFENYHGARPYRHVQREYGVVVEPRAIRLKASPPPWKR
ncbi:MAG: DUF362 domain-containing protein [Thermodesulfovibrionales bacterium]